MVTELASVRGGVGWAGFEDVCINAAPLEDAVVAVRALNGADDPLQCAAEDPAQGEPLVFGEDDLVQRPEDEAVSVEMESREVVHVGYQ